MVEMTHRLRSSGSTFMYLYHLISIDLQLSHSFNSPTLHCYSYEPGSHYLLSNQSTYCTIKSITSFKKSLLLSPLQYLKLLHLSNERTIDLSQQTYLTTNGRIK